MSIQAQLHDGTTLEFPDGTDPAVIQATVKRQIQARAAPAKPPVNGAADAAKSLWTGVKESVTGLPALLGDVENAYGQGVDFVAGKAIGALQDKFGRNVVPGAAYMGKDAAPSKDSPVNYAHASGFGTSQDLNDLRQKVTGQDYQPQTKVGQYARTVGAFVPNALLPGSIPARAAAVVAPALVSETAGQAAKDTQWEPAARIAGAVVGGGLAAAAHGTGIPRPAPPPVAPSALQEAVDAFDAAGVRPTGAAVLGRGAAGVAKTVAENPLAGIRARQNLNASINDTRDAASRLAANYGADRGPQLAGEQAQEGAQRFAQGTGAELPPDVARSLPSQRTTFGDKADALYTRAERLIGDNTQTLPMENTSQALADIGAQWNDPVLRARNMHPVFKQLIGDLNRTGGEMSWNDAAKLRSKIRTDLMADPTLRGNVTDAQVNSVYGGLTKDLQNGAGWFGGPEAEHAYKQANTFYRAGMDRINTALKTIDGAPSGEAAYDRIQQAAGSGSKADAAKLLQIKRSLPPDQWGDVVATTVKRLGQPARGATDAMDPNAFSVSRFVSNYAGLSPAGREILFGATGGGGKDAAALRSELDNLAKVAGMQKGVEAAANHSKTMVSGQALATVGGLANPVTTLPTVKLLSGMALTGEALTNPAAVRALARLTTASKAGSQAFRSELGRLRVSAQQNAALIPIYDQAVRTTLPSPTEKEAVNR